MFSPVVHWSAQHGFKDILLFQGNGALLGSPAGHVMFALMVFESTERREGAERATDNLKCNGSHTGLNGLVPHTRPNVDEVC